jgi:hypothetical protein
VKRLVAIALPVLALSACASHVQDDESGPIPADDDEAVLAYDDAGPDGSGPVVATMVTRDYRLAVRTTGQDPVFTVMRSDGGVLAENIDLWQLARDYPQLHRQFETAFAGEGIRLDARADTFGRECEGCGAGHPSDARR